MSYLVCKFNFEEKVPELNAVRTKCSELAGIEICENERGIYICEIPNEIINVAIDKKSITLSGFFEDSPFLLTLVTNYLINIGGKTTAKKKPLNLPTTINDIYAYNENIRNEIKKASPIMWALIIIFILLILFAIGGVFFGVFKIFI